jgi:hypothetical protein
VTDLSLAVRFGDLQSMVTALKTAQDGLSQRVQVMRGDVESFVGGWASDTESRQAQQDFDRRLGQWNDELAAALGTIRAALVTTIGDARAAEIRSVAIMD